MPNPHRKGITVPQEEWDSWQDYVDVKGFSSRSALIRAAVKVFIARDGEPGAKK